MLGEKTVYMTEIMKQWDGRSKNYRLYMRLNKSPGSGNASGEGGGPGDSSPDAGANSSEMLVIITGLARVSLQGGPGGVGAVTEVNGGGNCSSPSAGSNGDAVRMRSRVSEEQDCGNMAGSSATTGGVVGSGIGSAGAYGTNHATSVGAIKRNSGLNWSGEVNGGGGGVGGAGAGGDAKLQQRIVSQVSGERESG